MTNNVGGIDRVARVIIGALLVILSLIGTIGVWGWIGIVPLATGLFGSCPLYRIFGVNTCPIRVKQV